MLSWGGLFYRQKIYKNPLSVLCTLEKLCLHIYSTEYFLSLHGNSNFYLCEKIMGAIEGNTVEHSTAIFYAFVKGY
jgi:hypothetical protein